MAVLMLEEYISELEGQLGVAPGEAPGALDAQPGIDGRSEARAPSKAPSKATKKAKAPKAPKAPKAAPVDDAQPLVTRLDVRVGRIEDVWEVENSEKLFAERIDVGEAEPRLICSGLRHFYSLDEMRGRKLLVFCNLKPRKMGDLKSHGMVLCAETGEGEARRVEFVDPPPDASVGERVTFEGLEGEPWVPNQIAKKKVLENVFAGLRVNETGEATWEGARFMTSAGVVMAPTLRDCAMH